MIQIWALHSTIMGNKDAVDLLVAVYFLAVVLGVASLYLFKYENLRHGHIEKGISKNLYCCFYLYAACLYLLVSKLPNIYMVFLVRRLVESLVHRYSRRSRLSWCQFAFSFSYYTVLCLYLCDKEIPPGLFLGLNAVQMAAHVLVFRYRLRYLHYIAEVLIYTHLFSALRSVQSLLVLAYVVLFAGISMRMRCAIEKEGRRCGKKLRS